VLSSFLPQIAVADLEAEELPSYHRNIDMDEVVLIHPDDDPQGAFRSRRRAFYMGRTRRFAPSFRRGAGRGCGGRAPASESIPTGC
jgi:homogentisate 1,2-dioxygenase